MDIQVTALRRRLQSNGSQSATQRLRQVSGKERRRVKHVNHETSKAIIEEARRIGAATIVMEDLTHIRDHLLAGRRMRARLHRWAFRQLQSFVQYKARAVGISVVYVNPAYTSQTCSACGQLGTRLKHRFECSCGLRAHADLRSEEHTSELQSPCNLVCRLLLEKKNVPLCHLVRRNFFPPSLRLCSLAHCIRQPGRS